MDPVEFIDYPSEEKQSLLLVAGWSRPGWYFWDETWTELHGPYHTDMEARVDLAFYLSRLESEEL